MTPLKAKFNATITAYQREYPVIIFAEIRPEKDILNFSITGDGFDLEKIGKLLTEQGFQESS